ncbi:arylsulfate sulfotransferase [Pedobacter sp. W3I1]|uniref:aryl-sulfate sulfotransferase n=1 Tax=Pedobacter sp. W3I1 TaxID=3042291 RepID=UPI002781EFCE|nr:aryl-sulfate sulfotransferase [Pedobacter sp. W3I1]MDQ0637533.1 arylsulfate sulfotransferase [Pedobacter sp. W3I1]
MKYFLKPVVLLVMLAFYGCYQGEGIKEIKVGLHNNNVLKIQIDVLANSNTDAYIEYWPDKLADAQREATSLSKNKRNHKFVLCNIIPKTSYAYQIITVKNGAKNASKTYTFVSNDLPEWLKDQFKAKSADDKLIPKELKNGLILVNKRYSPGMAYLVDYKGRLRWYHMVDNVGFKVINFTKDKTLLSILGGNDEPTSYGSQILELNLEGDTILYLKKGQGDFKQTIHHEILKNKKGELVTLFVDQKITDLSHIGGSKQDTINGDGILVMDSKGKQVWKWSVFDSLDPFSDQSLLKTKKDWMHANSLNYDKDGNYIISFYNNGQIWKIDAKTGKVIWKFGKGGNIKMPAHTDFSQAHAVHINAEGNLMFFDNGIEKHRSGAYAFKLNEQKQSASLDMHIQLPPQIYNDRMGSAYMINKENILCCSSKRHIVVLTDRKGVLLWTMEASVPAYRGIFVTSDQLSPYLKP